jgi:ubiquinone biosynthesis protein COQ9
MSNTAWAEETEQRLLDAALPIAATEGWSGDLAARAGAALGMSRGEVELLTPHGARDLAALLAARHDAAALRALSGVDAASLKIRERIRTATLARLDAALADEAATRRWMGFLALPLHLPLASRLVWASADGLWRWAGDTATDENHYSKRAILAGILVSCLAAALASGRPAAESLLDARIENVMAYERLKARFKPADFARDLAGALAGLRYGKP